MIAILEDVFEKILRQFFLKEDHILKCYPQTALKTLTYNYFDINYKELRFNQKRSNSIFNLQDKSTILRLDKGQ